MDDFITSLDERPRQLVFSLDERYLAWAGQLPAVFQELALAESTFTGRAGHRLSRLSSSVNPVNMHSPWLFWKLFEGLDDEAFLNIAEAGAFWSLSAIVLDHLVDGQSEKPAQGLLFQHILLQRSRSCFREIFQLASPFWSYFDLCERQYLDALGSESFTQLYPEKLTYEAFEQTARAKAATMLVSISALVEASCQPSLLPPIEKSIQCCALAGQLYDDLLDWPSDLDHGHMTWALMQLVPEITTGRDAIPGIETLRTRVHSEGLDLHMMKAVLNQFAEAEGAVQELDCPGWKVFLKDYREIVRRDQRASAADFLQRALSPAIAEHARKPGR